MAKFNYGRRFKKGNRDVMYRYTNKKKSSKILVDARTKKPIQRGTKTVFGPTYRRKK